MESLLDEALTNYMIYKPKVEFLRHNENMTYKLTDAATGRKYVLRIHKSSETFLLDLFGGKQHSKEMLKSEMEIIYALKTRTDLFIQSPVPNIREEFVSILSDGTPVTVLTWLDGENLNQVKMSPAILSSVGETIGRLHYFFKNWELSSKTNRFYYDQQLMFKISDRISNARSCGALSREQAKIIQNSLIHVLYSMKELDFIAGSKGLTHADLSKSNMILTRSGIVPIDFCLCGFSYYYMDLGSVFNYFTGKAERKYILQGYQNIIREDLESKYIESFMAFQIILNITSQYKKADELPLFSDAIEKWCREIFIPLNEGQSFAL